ncbi:MAG: hypothetical protein Q8O72_17400 [Bacteroidales bacterium]|nr:hypothetical protein [Bacteroidales bacterium]
MENPKAMLIYFIAIYLLVTFILTLMGIDGKSEGVRIFLLSLFLTPIVGMLFMMKERRKATPVHYYYCHECDYIFPVKMYHCPMCQENGKKVRLTKYVSPHKITNQIGQLKLS